ncbi:MAG: hypothetical protein ACJ76F_01015 [Bacteroidia bacterium]
MNYAPAPQTNNIITTIMFSLQQKQGSVRKAIFTLAIILLNVFAISAEEKFGMDESANTAFNPMYSYIILGAVFVLAIVVYIIFKPKDKPHTHVPPPRSASRAVGSRDPRRRSSSQRPM